MSDPQKDWIHLSFETYEDLKKFKQAVIEHKSIGYYYYRDGGLKVFSDNETIKVLIQSIEEQAKEHAKTHEELMQLKEKYRVK